MSEAETLLPCPWCRQPLYVRTARANPYGQCRTPDCFGSRMPVVNLDDPQSVAAWNRRPAPPQPVQDVMERATAVFESIPSPCDCKDNGGLISMSEGEYHRYSCPEVALRKLVTSVIPVFAAALQAERDAAYERVAQHLLTNVLKSTTCKTPLDAAQAAWKIAAAQVRAMKGT